MAGKNTSQSGFSKWCAAIALCIAGLAALLGFFGGPLLRFIRESSMQQVNSAHYEILYSRRAASADAIQQFAKQREAWFANLNEKAGGAASNAKIRIIFNPATPLLKPAGGAPSPYTVTGTTIRTEISGPAPQLDPAADAEAILHAAWGNPGVSRIGPWAARWLAGEWHGEELGMAAAEVEQRIGHQNIATLLHPSPGEISSPVDQNLLGAAWISEVADLDGPAAVRKLYSSKLPALDAPDVARAMNTTPLELDRKWQMWMYSYLAGMPSTPNSMSMPMVMPMQ